MSTPQITEERLRTWLLSQADRERLCLGVLALDPRFLDVRPRRPKGGPDGSRDIVAFNHGNEIVWGAVGFRNNAQDSDEDKRWCTRKFKSDLDSALGQNENLWGFVFFTNIDLTPSEVSALEDHARKAGVAFVEIFYRERIRVALDGPRGLALRFQHLGITLSDAEQAAFFAEYGKQLESLLMRNFGAIDEKLHRLEFLQDRSKPLARISLLLKLKRERTSSQLGHFRFVAQIMDLHRPDPHPALWIAGRDALWALHGSESKESALGLRSIIWSQNPNKLIRSGVLVGAKGLGGAAFQTYDTYSPEDKADIYVQEPDTSVEVSRLGAGGWIRDDGPFQTLGDLDGRNLTIYMTKPLFEEVNEILLLANQYAITRMPIDRLVTLDQQPHFEWPLPLTPEEISVPWVVVLIKTAEPNSAAPYWTNWSLEFARYTPRKLPLQPLFNTPTFDSS